jgi:hypothetical protein
METIYPLNVIKLLCEAIEGKYYDSTPINEIELCDHLLGKYLSIIYLLV